VTPLKTFFSSSSSLQRIQVILGLILLGLLFLYVAHMAYLFLIQNSIVFPRNTQPIDIKKTPLSTFEQVQTTTEDGEHVLLWVSPPKGDKPVILFFHGNSTTLQSPGLIERFATLAHHGFGVVALSYRGYGGSTGIPSEKGVKLDSEAAYSVAFQRFGKKHKIMAYGESLGTGIAVYLATQKPLAAVILQSPYTSLRAVAKANYPFPAEFFVKYPFSSDQIIGQINSPLLILHGAQDKLIPVEQAEMLYALARPPKRLVIFTQGSHGLAETTQEILKFLDDLGQNSLPPEEKIRINAS